MKVNREFQTKIYELTTMRLPNDPFDNSFSNSIDKYMEDEMHWDYYDALTSTDQSIQGRLRGEVSTHLKCIDKYMKISRSINKESKKGTKYYPINNSTNPNDYSRLPPPFNELIKYQEYDGKWSNLQQVLKILSMPTWIVINGANEWEAATSIAAAFIRQNIELFDRLSEYHDNAMKCLPNAEFVFIARELLAKYQYNEELYPNPPRKFEILKRDESERKEIISTFGTEDSDNLEADMKLLELNGTYPQLVVPALKKQKKKSKADSWSNVNETYENCNKSLDTTINHHTLRDGITYNYEILKQEQDEAEERKNKFSYASKKKSDNDDDDNPEEFIEQLGLELLSYGSTFVFNSAIPKVIVNDAPSLVPYTTIGSSSPSKEKKNDTLKIDTENSTTTENSEVLEAVSPQSSVDTMALFQERMKAVTPQKDKARIRKSQQRIDNLTTSIIQQCLDIESKVKSIIELKDRCMNNFNNCETFDERNLCFDELTATLGDDVAPREGFLPGDWRGNGVKGIRPIMIQFFCSVQELADERLHMEELQTPGGRQLGNEKDLDDNRGRWGLIWDGKEIVSIVLHALDPLRECRELSNWY